MFGRDEAEVSHQLARRLEATDIAGYGKNGCSNSGADATHGAESIEDGLHCPLSREQVDLLGDVFDPLIGGQHVIDVVLKDDLMGWKLELLIAEPAVMCLCP